MAEKLHSALDALIETTQDFTDSAYMSHANRERMLLLTERLRHELGILLSTGACMVREIVEEIAFNYVLLNPFRLSFSEPKCARGGHIIFLESIFQHSPHEIVIYSSNRKSYNKKVNIL